MKRFLYLFIAILICLGFTGCEKATPKNQVAATTLPVYEIATALCAGTDIAVTRLISENVSCLHDYTLQVSQMRALETATTVIISGAGFEDFLSDILPSSKPIINASKNINLLSCESHDDHDHEHANDPHIWLSPENAKTMSENILSGLTTLFPQHTDTFQANHAELAKKFDALSAHAQEQLSTLSSRKLITFHDGLGYMAQAFGLEIVHSIEEESGSEASAAELIEIIRLMKSHSVHAVFTEKNGSTSAAEIIAAETGAKVYELDMAISGDSYFDAMYHNIKILKEALG